MAYNPTARRYNKPAIAAMTPTTEAPVIAVWVKGLNKPPETLIIFFGMPLCYSTVKVHCSQTNIQKKEENTLYSGVFNVLTLFTDVKLKHLTLVVLFTKQTSLTLTKLLLIAIFIPFLSIAQSKSYYSKEIKTGNISKVDLLEKAKMWFSDTMVQLIKRL